MRKSNNFYYFTLKDIFTLKELSTKLFDVETLKNLIDNLFSDFIKKSGYYYNETHTNNLWQLIYAKYHENFILKSKNVNLTDKDIFNGMKEIFIKIEETYPKYDAILNKMAEQNFDLFAPIKNKITTSSTSKYNDTPQETSSGGLEGDEFVSNITKNSSDNVNENDSMTIMARIMEINQGYKNILDEWAKEFFELFIEEANIREDC